MLGRSIFKDCFMLRSEMARSFLRERGPSPVYPAKTVFAILLHLETYLNIKKKEENFVFHG